MFSTSQGPVVELVFWSQAVDRWIHGVAAYFERELPAGHVQVTIGDLAWIQHVVSVSGIDGLRMCIDELEQYQFPEAAD
jgi:hypothetical protein